MGVALGLVGRSEWAFGPGDELVGWVHVDELPGGGSLNSNRGRTDDPAEVEAAPACNLAPITQVFVRQRTLCGSRYGDVRGLWSIVR